MGFDLLMKSISSFNSHWMADILIGWLVEDGKIGFVEGKLNFLHILPTDIGMPVLKLKYVYLKHISR